MPTFDTKNPRIGFSRVNDKKWRSVFTVRQEMKCCGIPRYHAIKFMILNELVCDTIRKLEKH